MDSIKLWLVNVGVKQMGPSLIRAGIALLMGFLAAHQGLLTHFGVIWDASSKTLTLRVDTLQEWLLGGGLGLLTAFMTAAQHHTTAALTGQPQDGSHLRASDVQSTQGGTK